MKAGKLPAIAHLYPVLQYVKGDVPLARSHDAKDYTADEESAPGIDITIGWNPESGDWSYQTGDNSFTGGAYGYPVWATGRVYRSTNCRELARDLIAQLDEQRSN